MSDLILHHYPGSPFSEKIRALLGAKGLPWKSVVTPSIAPKPDLVALTGGYRKAPVLQVGSDVYCDTRSIARALDRLRPEPPLFSRTNALAETAACEWLDSSFFFVCVALTMQPKAFGPFAQALPPEEAAGFMADRAKFMEGARIPRFSLADAEAAFAALSERLEADLADRPFLSGGAAGALDFSAYHPIWFVGRNRVAATYLEPYARVNAWRERMQALTRAPQADLSGEDAVEICRQSGVDRDVDADAHTGDLARGERVSVTPTDYGFDAVEGTLELASPTDVILRRTDARAGEVRVHFPRSGFSIVRADGRD